MCTFVELALAKVAAAFAPPFACTVLRACSTSLPDLSVSAVPKMTYVSCPAQADERWGLRLDRDETSHANEGLDLFFRDVCHLRPPVLSCAASVCTVLGLLRSDMKTAHLCCVRNRIPSRTYRHVRTDIVRKRGSPHRAPPKTCRVARACNSPISITKQNDKYKLMQATTAKPHTCPYI